MEQRHGGNDSRRQSGGGTGRRSAGPVNGPKVHAGRRRRINFVHSAPEFKKRQRGERVNEHKRDWKGCAENPIVKALRTDIEQSAPIPIVGGGWITRARKIP